MWQMTFDELESDSFKPVAGKVTPHSGIMHWFCPICGEHVGMYNTGSVHRDRIEYRRSKCKNGHVIDWT